MVFYEINDPKNGLLGNAVDPFWSLFYLSRWLLAALVNVLIRIVTDCITRCWSITVAGIIVAVVMSHGATVFAEQAPVIVRMDIVFVYVRLSE